MQIPVEFQNVAAEYSSLFKQDVIQYASALTAGITKHITALWTNRNGQMLCKMAQLAHASRSDGSSAGGSTCEGVADGPTRSYGGGAGGADGPARSHGDGGGTGAPTRGGAPDGQSPSAAGSEPPTNAAADASHPSSSPAAAALGGIGAATSTSGGGLYYDDIPSFDLFKQGELDNEEQGDPKVPTCHTPPATSTGSTFCTFFVILLCQFFNFSL